MARRKTSAAADAAVAAAAALSQTGGLSTAFSIVDYGTDHVLPLHSYEGALHDVIVSIKAYHVNERLAVSGGGGGGGGGAH